MPPIRVTINGVERVLADAPSARLVDVLRDSLMLRATRLGCGEGACGACHVLVDGRSVAACNTPLAAVAGQSVVTVEGLGGGALQRAFIAEQAAQCGYCTSGLLITATALLQQQPAIDDDTQVRQALDAHLCRCGSHNRVVRAVLRAARELHT